MSTTFPKLQYPALMEFPNFQLPFQSKFNMSCLSNNPHDMGTYIKERINKKDQLFTFLAMANEEVINKVPVWTEEGERVDNWDIPNILQRVGDTITIDDTAYETYLQGMFDLNVDECIDLDDADKKFNFREGTEIMVVDAEGNRDFIEVTAIANDKKSLTAKVKNGTWTTDDTEFQIMPIAQHVNPYDCDFGDCNKFYFKNPSYSNGFATVGHCFEINEREIIEGEGMFRPDKNNPEYIISRNWDYIHEDHSFEIYKKLVLGQSTRANSDLENAGGGLSDNFKGLYQQITERGITSDMDFSLEFLTQLADYFDSINSDCTNLMFYLNTANKALANSVPQNGVELRYDPFQELTKKDILGDGCKDGSVLMRNLNFDAIRINNHNFYWTKWDMFTKGQYSSDMMQSAYKGMFMPYGFGKIRLENDSASTLQNYISVFWKGKTGVKTPEGTKNIVYKMRQTGGSTSLNQKCYKINIESEFSLVALGVEKMGLMLGKL